MRKILVLIAILLTTFLMHQCVDNGDKNNNGDDTATDEHVNPDLSTPQLRGKYLATIGVCNACHTPPNVGSTKNGQTKEDSILKEIKGRTNPDWKADLDESRQMSGGVPFWMRFGPTMHGVVYSTNITPDNTTGIGGWTDQELYTVIKTGKKKDGTSLFLFPPHSFFKNLSEGDVKDLISYLRTLAPVTNTTPAANLPFPTAPDSLVVVANAPQGRSIERGKYLTSAIVGCAECHSHTDTGGVFHKFAGGNPQDPFLGVFKLGPDLPIRATEKGFSAFPYPGYALLYSGNLTRFGIGGDQATIPTRNIVNAIRKGIKLNPDAYGRPVPMEHVMMWQYYREMSDDDIYSIVEYIKSINYIPNNATPGLYNYGTDWEMTFTKMFGQPPTATDKQFFGK